MAEIINIKASMNKGLTTLLRNNFASVIPVVKLKVNLVTINLINYYWFLGFTDAEGCFFVNVHANRKKNSLWVSLVFSLVQNSRDVFLFETLKMFLGCGNIFIHKSVVRLRVEKFYHFFLIILCKQLKLIILQIFVKFMI